MGLPAYNIEPEHEEVFRQLIHDDVDGAVYTFRHMFTDQYELFDYKIADFTDEHRKAPSGFIALQPKQGKAIFIRPKYSDERYLNRKSVFSCPKDPFIPLI